MRSASFCCVLRCGDVGGIFLPQIGYAVGEISGNIFCFVFDLLNLLLDAISVRLGRAPRFVALVFKSSQLAFADVTLEIETMSWTSLCPI